MKCIGIDVGGTFTDFVLSDSDAGTMSVLKLSSGGDTSATMLRGIEELCQTGGFDIDDIDLVIHGTTVATNALLEFDGAKAAMVTTEGFRDVIHIGRHQRPQNYSVQQDIAWQARPLVARRYRQPVSERLIPPSGEVLHALDEDGVRAAARGFLREGIEAVSVCFLFSYLNDVHERRAAEILREEMPDAYVCTSSEVMPQFREFERFTTTAINAFVGPKVESYISQLERRIRDAGISAPLHIMQSNGGTATPDVACKKPVTLLLSGPVGGVMGGVWSAEGQEKLLVTVDVGGTSADIGIVTDDGLVEARARDTWIAGYPIMAPTLDIETIGAGGGSIAYLDVAGAVHVGPRSAGADPGPAAYGRGGTEPTVTDANVVLGRLPHKLAGRLELDLTAAETAVGLLADRVGVSVLEMAAGIVQIMNENMAGAIRQKTLQRGLDPRSALLSLFGGGGPIHAVELARILDIPEVIIPPNPGVTSAVGLLNADLRYDSVWSVLRPLATVDIVQIESQFEEQESLLQAQLHRDGAQRPDIVLDRSADLRYHGQSYELKVPIGPGRLSHENLEGLLEAFYKEHLAEFGHNYPGAAVEIVNCRVTATGHRHHLERILPSPSTLTQAHLSDADVAFTVDGSVVLVPTAIYERDLLPVDVEIQGPAIFVQTDSTTLMPPGSSARRDTIGNLLIQVRA